MLSALLLYLINYKRKTDEPLMTVAKIKEHLPDWLQAVAFGMTLWYCYEYMNGLYDIQHAYSTCKIIVWLSIAIICTYKKKELIGIIPIAYFIVSAIAGYFWARAYVGVVEKDELYRLYAYVLVFGGTVIVNTITCIVALIRKKITFSKINPIYAGCLGLYLILLLIFRNTRLWPILLLVLSIFFYFRMGVWEKRNRLMENFCNGVILNFLYMMVYCWLHRPFHYYVYYRYNMAYHTVTMTAVHLTLVIAAALVKILVTYKKIKAGEKEKQSMLIPMTIFGAAGAYLIFTLTRTGYLACVLTVFCMLLVFAFMEKKWKNFFIPALIMIVGTLYIFPPAFTLQRIMPALSNDPIYSEVEALPPECSIKKGNSSASNHYINIDYFIRRFANRILMMDVEWSNQESTSLPDNTPFADALLASANDANIYEIIDDETTLYLASAEDENLDNDNEETDEEDVTNGRLEIYQRYIEEWNMTGHAEMGLDFPDGTNSIHAHDVYLQMIHDHGLPSGIYIIVFILGSLVFAVIYWKNNRKDPYGMLIAAVLLGFLGAGITEWIFHPCNPFGISLLIVMTPLVFYKH